MRHHVSMKSVQMKHSISVPLAVLFHPPLHAESCPLELAPYNMCICTCMSFLAYSNRLQLQCCLKEDSYGKGKWSTVTTKSNQVGDTTGRQDWDGGSKEPQHQQKQPILYISRALATIDNCVNVIHDRRDVQGIDGKKLVQMESSLCSVR